MVILKCYAFVANDSKGPDKNLNLKLILKLAYGLDLEKFQSVFQANFALMSISFSSFLLRVKLFQKSIRRLLINKLIQVQLSLILLVLLFLFFASKS